MPVLVFKTARDVKMGEELTYLYSASFDPEDLACYAVAQGLVLVSQRYAAWWHSKSVDFRVTKLTDNSWQPVWEDFDDAKRGEMAYCGKVGALPITSTPNYPSKTSMPLDEADKEQKDADSILTIETADTIRQTGPPLF